MSAPAADVCFEYRITGAGWADAALRIDGATAEMRSSYVTDALGDLVHALVDLTNGAPGARFHWDPEGGHIDWYFSRHGRVVDLRIVPDMGARARDLLAASVDMETLVRAVVSGARGSLSGSWGADHYEEEWGHPYPSAELLELEDWLAADPADRPVLSEEPRPRRTWDAWRREREDAADEA